MEEVDRVWKELKEFSSLCGGKLPVARLPLSSFQFPKEKKWRGPQERVFAIKHAFRNILSTSSIPRTINVSPIAKDEELVDAFRQGDSNKGKTYYSLENWQALASTVHRQANILKEESSNAKRYKSLSQLKEIFIERELPHAFYDNAFQLLLEPLLLCLSDPTEVARDLAASLLFKFLVEVSEVDGALDPVLEALVVRFGSQDIEGVAHLPPVMRPEPEYKPLQLIPIEKSEDVRQTLLQVLYTVLDRSSDECVWNHLDLATGLLRAGAMDACPKIKSAAVGMIVEFCDRHQHMLLHFTEPLTRSLLSCLVHQHAKIRMEALRALTHVLACGLYKYNGEIIQMLAGWRDPNFVPIKSLYETTTIRNYFAELLADHSPMVRMFFFDTSARWLLEFKDKSDYESWVLPYLLSGLFDPFRPIQQLVFSLMERLGKNYEATHEKDLREIKQLGTPEPWSYEGKATITFPLGGRWKVADETSFRAEKKQFVSFVRSYSERLRNLGFGGCSLTEAEKDKFLEDEGALVNDPPRPSLGTRTMVKSYFRRYANTLFAPVEDFKEVTMTTSARLMVVSLAYVEDSFVEWVDHCLRICARVLSSAHSYSAEAVEAYQVVMRLVGIFIEPENYWSLVKDILAESCTEETHLRVAMLGLLALMLQGSFKALHQASDPALGLGRVASIVPEIAEALAHTDLLQEQFVNFAADNVTKVVEVLIDGTVQQNATFSEITSCHLLNVICSLASPGIKVDDGDGTELSPQLQELLGNLARCSKIPNDDLAVPGTMESMWSYAGLSMSMPPSNLAALSTFLRWLPSFRLCQEETCNVALVKLDEFSSATQATATRRSARRTALRLVRRLVLLDPTDDIRVHNAGTTPSVPTQVETSTFKTTPEKSHQSYNNEEQAQYKEETVDYLEPVNFPTKAAAEILSRVVLSGLKKPDWVGDLKDILAALKEFLTLLQPSATVKRQAVQDLFVMSGLAEDLCWLLREPCLHTKLFRISCEAYAHDCAVTYSDKNPATVLDNMPLGKRRELRLSAIKTAAAFKQEAALLLRIVLTSVSGHHATLSLIISSAIESLHPPDKVRKRRETSMPPISETTINEPDASIELPMNVKAEIASVIGGPNTDCETMTAAEDTALRCQASLPFQAQSPWLLFQISSCLIDALMQGIACCSGLPSREEITIKHEGSQCDCSLPLLTMPFIREIPMFSHLELQAARQILLKLTSDAYLCQGIDSCVRQLVELESAVSATKHSLPNVSLDEDPWLRRKGQDSLKELLETAERQSKSVSVVRQKEQASLVLIQLIRLVGKLYPTAVDECLRQYETSGRFSRREILARII